MSSSITSPNTNCPAMSMVMRVPAMTTADWGTAAYWACRLFAVTAEGDWLAGDAPQKGVIVPGRDPVLCL